MSRGAIWILILALIVVALLVGRYAISPSASGSASTPLDDACKIGDQAKVKTLIAQGADVNAQSPTTMQTPLLIATNADMLNVANLLIDAGAKVNVHDNRNKTPLLNAVLSGDAGMLTLLFAHGADVTAVDDMHNSVLHIAANTGKNLIIEQLLANKAQINALDNLGNTPLMQAARYGQGPIVKILLAHGADFKVKNKYRQTALALAGKLNPDIVAMLKQAGEKE